MKFALVSVLLAFFVFSNEASASNFNFSGAINPKTANSLIEKIQKQLWNGDRDIVITLDSRGGEIPSALAIVKYLKQLKSSGRRIVTYNRSLCASACTILFAAGDVRMATPRAQFLFHSVGVKGAGKKREEVQTYWAGVWADQVRFVDWRLAYELNKEGTLVGRKETRTYIASKLNDEGYTFVNYIYR